MLSELFTSARRNSPLGLQREAWRPSAAPALAACGGCLGQRSSPHLRGRGVLDIRFYRTLYYPLHLLRFLTKHYKALPWSNYLGTSSAVDGGSEVPITELRAFRVTTCVGVAEISKMLLTVGGLESGSLPRRLTVCRRIWPLARNMFCVWRGCNHGLNI